MSPRRFIVSSPRRSTKDERAYLLNCINNPDPGSTFDRKTRRVREWNLPGWLLILLLRLAGYHNVIFTDKWTAGMIAGHVFYQIHGRECRMFSLFVDPSLRKQGCGSHFIMKALEQAWQLGCTSARIGSGKDAVVNKIWEKLTDGSQPLPFKVEKGPEPGSVVMSAYAVSQPAIMQPC